MLFYADVICQTCRSGFERYNGGQEFLGYPFQALYVYNDMFSSVLIQYKECLDETLQDVFMYEQRKSLKKKYKGYTFLLMPSSEKALKRRGFSHLEKMVEGLGVAYMEPFVKLQDVKQKTLSYAMRQELTGWIALKDGVTIPRKIVLFDDVLTSGATLKGALACLEPKEHEIQILVVAKVLGR